MVSLSLTMGTLCLTERSLSLSHFPPHECHCFAFNSLFKVSRVTFNTHTHTLGPVPRACEPNDPFKCFLVPGGGRRRPKIATVAGT